MADQGGGDASHPVPTQDHIMAEAVSLQGSDSSQYSVAMVDVMSKASPQREKSLGGKTTSWKKQCNTVTTKNIFPSCVVSTTCFYAYDKDEKLLLDHLTDILSNNAKIDHTQIKEVVNGMVCAYEAEVGWVRARVSKKCNLASCSLRLYLRSDTDVVYVHIVLMDYGNVYCVPQGDLMMVPRDLQDIPSKAQQYLLKDVINNDSLDKSLQEEVILKHYSHSASTLFLCNFVFNTLAISHLGRVTKKKEK
ncbi:uncharacterized protein [Cherax quadricarinatus]|uniref:uncharacterized protein isoform X2 n=1 Tax=Cherax quadricarinatus TaxID=27406 RepID=UPI00387E6015